MTDVGSGRTLSNCFDTFRTIYIALTARRCSGKLRSLEIWRGVLKRQS